jgi:hypothetical protein
VLWDDETRHARDGLLQPGRTVVLRGATVKAGYRGGVELGLGSAVLEAIDAPAAAALEGRIAGIGAVRPVGGGTDLRFNADVQLVTTQGTVEATCWDDALKAIRALGAGHDVRIEGAEANPLLPGRWTVPAEARVLPGGTAK